MLRRPTKQTRRNREGWDFCFPYLGKHEAAESAPLSIYGGCVHRWHIIGGIT